MKKITMLDRIKSFSNEELAIYVISLSIFLPFYLFLAIFFLYFLVLLLTGKLTPVIKSLKKAPFLLGFIIYSAIISIIATNWIGLVVSILMMLFFIFFRYYEKIITPELFHTILQAFVLLSFVAVGFAFLEHYQLVQKFDYSFISPAMQRLHENRAEVTFFNPNYYGLVCCFIIMLCFYFIYVTHSMRWKLISILGIIANAVALNLTQNRSAFPAIICGAIIYLFTTIKNSHAFWLSVAFFSFAIWLLFSSNIGMRMVHVEDSLDVRVSIWQSAIEMIHLNGLIGQGPLTYLHEYPVVGAPHHEHAHSLYIDTLLSYGYLGVSLVLVSCYGVVQQFLTFSRTMVKRPIVGLILSFFVVVAVHGVVDLAIFWIQTGFIFLLVITTMPMWVQYHEEIPYRKKNS